MTPHIQTPPRDSLIWIGLDYDGTLARSVWSPENPGSATGEPIWENVQKARKLAEAGYKLIVHTARPWSDYEALESWMNHYEVPFKAIVCGKLLVAAYIDDRGFNANAEDWVAETQYILDHS